ncbi:cytosine permease [Streptomyces sp. NPDC055144]
MTSDDIPEDAATDRCTDAISDLIVAKQKGREPPHVLGATHRTEEYEHTPVPASARHSLPSVAATWFGFPMNLGSAVFCGVIVYNLGLPQGLLAILVGNLVLLAYVGALSHHAGGTGKNFALLTADTFGSRGRNLPAGLLATVVIGWFSFQVGLTGTTLGWPALADAAVGGVLYTLLTMAGIRALSLIGMIAMPCSSCSRWWP